MGYKWGKRLDLNLSLLFLVLLCNLLLLTTSAEDQSPLSPFIIPATGPATSFHQSIACSNDTENTLKDFNIRCLSSSYSTNTSSSSSSCDRLIHDDLFSREETDTLLHIALKGMGSASSAGGPTILDLNTGYLRDSESGLKNLFLTHSNLFSPEDFEAYGRIIKKLKGIVESFFGTPENVLFFTAPTFITRLDGNPLWQPQEIHDEYWHTHADMENTPHYHYSGLLYLSTYQTDFTGGRFHFVRPKDDEEEKEAYEGFVSEQVIEPRKGRVVIFTSGKENKHYVERVKFGQRFVLSFWFTCNPERQFEIFLDGKAHVQFSHRVKNSLKMASSKKKEEKEISEEGKSEL